MTATVEAPVRKPPLHRAAWRMTWLLLAFLLINFADKTVLGLASTPMMKDLGIDHQQYGVAASAFFALFSVSALAGSVLTRRVSSKWLLLAMALLWSAAQLPMLADVGFGALIGTRVLLGAAEGPAFPVATHAVYTWFEDRHRVLPTAVLTVGSAAGVALSAPLLTWVINQHGWRWAFGAVGLVGLVWAGAWAVWGEEGPEQVRGAAEPAADQQPAVPLRRILLTGTWLTATFGAFAAYWQLAAALTWGADYFKEAVGVSSVRTGYIIMATGLSSAVVLLAYGLLAQRLRLRDTGTNTLGLAAGIAMAVAGLSIVGFALTGSLTLKVVLMVGPMTLVNIIVVMTQNACAQIALPRQRATVLGATAFVYSLAGVLSPLVIGRVVSSAGSDIAGGYRTGYLITAGLVLTAGAAALRWLRPERDAAKLGLTR